MTDRHQAQGRKQPASSRCVISRLTGKCWRIVGFVDRPGSVVNDAYTDIIVMINQTGMPLWRHINIRSDNMAIARSQLGEGTTPRLELFIRSEYKQYPEEWHWPRVENSDRSFEEEAKLSGFGLAPIKDEGAAIAYDDAQEAYITLHT